VGDNSEELETCCEDEACKPVSGFGKISRGGALEVLMLGKVVLFRGYQSSVIPEYPLKSDRRRPWSHITAARITEEVKMDRCHLR
jgi:hypothetical protein